MGKVLTAWIPLMAPSMNALLYCIRGRHEARPEVRQFRSVFKSYLPTWCLASTGPYSLSLAFHENWYWKNGYPKKRDVPNLVKVCVDAIADRYGWDDSLLWQVQCEKVHDPTRIGIQITLRGLDVETPSETAFLATSDGRGGREAAGAD